MFVQSDDSRFHADARAAGVMGADAVWRDFWFAALFGAIETLHSRFGVSGAGINLVSRHPAAGWPIELQTVALEALGHAADTIPELSLKSVSFSDLSPNSKVVTAESLGAAANVLNLEQRRESIPDHGGFRPLASEVVAPEDCGCPSVPSLELRRFKLTPRSGADSTDASNEHEGKGGAT